MTKKFILLKHQIEEELAELTGVVNKIERMYDIVKQGKAEDLSVYTDSLALNLHGFYSGIEKILETIVEKTGEGRPAGGKWHRELLQQVTFPVEGIRPPVLSSDTRKSLEGYLDFRHRVRNIYAYNIDFDKMELLIKQVRTTFDIFNSDMSNFLVFLTEMQDSLEL
ncbi:MAG: hypothetical protein HY959_02040 [Ignavibacteriae bacterium]|nr:hypothetical protein [Ignavibacteriota bacterium]